MEPNVSLWDMTLLDTSSPSILSLARSCDETELTLIAKYDWKDGAKDMSGSSIDHSDVVEPDTSTEDGTLCIQSD